jgi:N-acetylglucosaminyldiphosphoundecaprenol N-acetyl-beta-D-mannosaminyltransferase
MMRVPTSRIQVGRIPIDVVDLQGALAHIEALVEAGKGGTVFTPNVDHVVQAESNEAFRSAYARASLSLVDGTPVLWASRLLGRPLPAKVSGSDLLFPLMQRAAARGWRVYLLGAGPTVAEQAARKLIERLPRLSVVGTDSPLVSLDQTAAADAAIAERVRKASPHLVLAAFGAPKQEVITDRIRHLVEPAVSVCVGAGIDFVAGIAKRAPAWMSRSGLEWLHRLAHDPRRLAGRYLLRDPLFFWIVARQLVVGGAQ